MQEADYGEMSKMEEVFLGLHDMLSQEALLDVLFDQMTKATYIKHETPWERVGSSTFAHGLK